MMEVNKGKDRKVALSLLTLLAGYVELCDMWEEHNSQAAGGRFRTTKVEKEDHQRIQREVQIPFMERCKGEGFNYSSFMSMIPPAFKTTVQQRWEMLEWFQEFVDEEYPDG